MARYRLTEVADQKIAIIYEYSVLKFGELQADRYFLGMHAKFESLADHPFLGRKSDKFGDGIRQFAYGVHIIFYRPESSGILILDIFGMRQATTISAESIAHDPDDVTGSDPGMED